MGMMNDDDYNDEDGDDNDDRKWIGPTCIRLFRGLPREIPNAGQDLTRPDNCVQT